MAQGDMNGALFNMNCTNAVAYQLICRGQTRRGIIGRKTELLFIVLVNFFPGG